MVFGADARSIDLGCDGSGFGAAQRWEMETGRCGLEPPKNLYPRYVRGSPGDSLGGNRRFRLSPARGCQKVSVGQPAVRRGGQVFTSARRTGVDGRNDE